MLEYMLKTFNCSVSEKNFSFQRFSRLIAQREKKEVNFVT